MSRRTVLILLALAWAVLAVFLATADPSVEVDGSPSIVEYEFAGSEERVAEIRGEWGGEGEDAARLSLRVDFLYLLVYGAFLTLAAVATRDVAQERGWRRLASLGALAVPAAPAGALCDAVENVFLLIALEGEGGDLAPAMAAIWAGIKFALVLGVLAYLLAGLLARFRARRRARAAA